MFSELLSLENNFFCPNLYRVYDINGRILTIDSFQSRVSLNIDVIHELIRSIFQDQLGCNFGHDGSHHTSLMDVSPIKQCKQRKTGFALKKKNLFCKLEITIYIYMYFKLLRFW
jgi:hypothetical protein